MEFTKKATADEVMQLLRNRFGSLHQQERYRAELRSRRRKPHESLQNLYTDLCRLISLAYPGQSSSLLDLVARDAFLQSLNDADLVVRILEKEPISLDEALNVACRIEAYDKCAGRSERSGPSDADYANQRPKYVRTAAMPSESTNQSDRVSQQLASMQQAFDRACGEIKSQREELKAQRTEMEAMRKELASGRGHKNTLLKPPEDKKNWIGRIFTISS